MKKLITEVDFSQAIAASDGTMLLFYSAWCPFCSSFVPVFEKSSTGAPDRFCKLDTDDLPALEDKFNIDVVPTVLFFRSGKLEKRLDGLLGRGLNEQKLLEFMASCGLPKPKGEQQ